VGGIGAGLAPHAPTAVPTPTLTRVAALPGPHTPPPDVIAELKRLQRPEDVPGIPVGHRLQASTFRVIDSSVLSNIYVARDVDRRICIVAVPIDDQFSATCGPDPKALHTPLLLLYTVLQPGRGSVDALAGLDPSR
jgi:hypothetical protein